MASYQVLQIFPRGLGFFLRGLRLLGKAFGADKDHAETVFCADKDYAEIFNIFKTPLWHGQRPRGRPFPRGLCTL